MKLSLAMGVLGLVMAAPVASAPFDPTSTHPTGPVSAPTAVTPDMIAVPISTALRSASLPGKTIAAPEHFRLTCEVLRDQGIATMCTSTDSDQNPKSWEDHVRNVFGLLDSLKKSQGDHAIIVAIARIEQMRLKPEVVTSNKDYWKLAIFDETVSPADALPPFAPAEAFAHSKLLRSVDPAVAQSLYPPLAIMRRRPRPFMPAAAFSRMVSPSAIRPRLTRLGQRRSIPMWSGY